MYTTRRGNRARRVVTERAQPTPFRLPTSRERHQLGNLAPTSGPSPQKSRPAIAKPPEESPCPRGGTKFTCRPGQAPAADRHVAPAVSAPPAPGPASAAARTDSGHRRPVPTRAASTAVHKQRPTGQVRPPAVLAPPAPGPASAPASTDAGSRPSRPDQIRVNGCSQTTTDRPCPATRSPCTAGPRLSLGRGTHRLRPSY